jgi:hypothetical protein
METTCNRREWRAVPQRGQRSQGRDGVGAEEVVFSDVV